MIKNPSTFSHTELSSSSPREKSLTDDYRLPASISYVSLRESFVSEAPFVKRSNAQFWRKVIDSSNFQRILASNYHNIVNCISEIGTFNVDLLYRFEGNPAITLMSESFSEIYFSFTLKERDTLMPKLPEVCLYLLINCLSSSHPKHNRIYSTIKFREILLDYFSELFTGIRLSNSRINRDWLFDHAVDMPLVTYSSEDQKGNDPRAKVLHDPSKGPAKSTYKIINSPLVRFIK